MSLLPVEEARDRLLSDVSPVAQTERVDLRSLAGRRLASDLSAILTQPSFDASAMDGYAVLASDLGTGETRLRLIGESAAGAAFEGILRAGEAVRIFTGAPAPQGADAVVIQENTERPNPETVLVREPVTPGRHIRPAGNDFREGAPLLRAGTIFRPASIALAASGGHAEVEVCRRPRVAILMTGSELVLPGTRPGPAQIVASNGFGIAAMVEASGGEALSYGVVADDRSALAAVLDRARRDEVDVFVTIGGASVGDHDLVAPVFRECGVELDFWKVAMRPGKPLMAGRFGEMRFLGLPGNPASSLVTAELFLRPLVERLAGRPAHGGYERGVLGTPVPANDHRAEFMRGRISGETDGKPRIVPFDRQDSSLLSVFALADVLLVRQPHAPPSETGDPCEFVRLA
ncbi:molybdopterin molybdotransferase MoeA [Aureimonas sp. AU40]|uniref:molybdopterin molybdotransferase MoeA n=1 Tax=Aureimonas sp. AU40 TaxID=1637747 RepID=UPI00078152E0|nr:gephyrin-like molybdotransferase Glp [Aureimonas sp. AU40]